MARVEYFAHAKVNIVVGRANRRWRVKMMATALELEEIETSRECSRQLFG